MKYDTQRFISEAWADYFSALKAFAIVATQIIDQSIASNQLIIETLELERESHEQTW